MLHARTPKDCMFVLVTQDILEMDATAQVIDAFLLKPFPSERKALSYLRDLFSSILISLVILLTVYHTILTMLVLRIWY